MSKTFSILFLISSIIFYGVFLFLALRYKKKNSILNTFPFETGFSFKKILIVPVLLSTILLFLFFFVSFPQEYRYGSFLIVIISGIIAAVSFLALNLINLNNYKVHFLIFCIEIAMNIFLSLFLGVSSLTLYRVYKEIAYVIFGILSLVICVLEVFLITPVFKFSLVMEDNDGTIKKPFVIRMAFYEWLYQFLLYCESILLISILFII